MTDSKKTLVRELRGRVGDENLEVVDSGKISKPVADMAAFHDKDDVSISASTYHCVTQSPIPANIPASDPLSIQMGLDGVIHRWKKGSTVQFAAFAKGYPTPDQALYAARRLNDAAMKWNELSLGVTFKWVTRLEDAAFVLAYGGDAGTTLARAFFPNDNDLNMVYVYQKAFEPGNVNYMVNIFLHELGHTLGLRHEFAPEVQAEGKTAQLGPRNPNSVMHYKFPPTIQPSDAKSTKEFYKLPGPKFDGWPIKDWTPNN